MAGRRSRSTAPRSTLIATEGFRRAESESPGNSRPLSLIERALSFRAATKKQRRLTLAEEFEQVVEKASINGTQSPRVLRPRPRTNPLREYEPPIRRSLSKAPSISKGRARTSSAKAAPSRSASTAPRPQTTTRTQNNAQATVTYSRLRTETVSSHSPSSRETTILHTPPARTYRSMSHTSIPSPQGSPSAPRFDERAAAKQDKGKSRAVSDGDESFNPLDCLSGRSSLKRRRVSSAAPSVSSRTAPMASPSFQANSEQYNGDICGWDGGGAEFQMLELSEVATLAWVDSLADSAKSTSPTSGAKTARSLYVAPGIGHFINAMKHTLQQEIAARYRAEVRHLEEQQRRLDAEQRLAALRAENEALIAEKAAWANLNVATDNLAAMFTHPGWCVNAAIEDPVPLVGTDEPSTNGRVFASAERVPSANDGGRANEDVPCLKSGQASVPGSFGSSLVPLPSAEL